MKGSTEEFERSFYEAYRQQGVTYADVQAWSNAIFRHLTEMVTKNEEVVIPDFGKFIHKHRKGTKGRNSTTGEALDIPPCHKLVFIPSRKVRDDIVVWHGDTVLRTIVGYNDLVSKKD